MKQQETTDVMHSVIFINTVEEQINSAPLSEILPALEAVAAIHNLNLKRVKEMKRAYRILIHLVKNN